MISYRGYYLPGLSYDRVSDQSIDFHIVLLTVLFVATGLHLGIVDGTDFRWIL